MNDAYKYQCANCKRAFQLNANQNVTECVCDVCGGQLISYVDDGSTSAAVGLIGGAALGASVGGPWGAIVGGVIGNVIGRNAKGLG